MRNIITLFTVLVIFSVSAFGQDAPAQDKLVVGDVKVVGPEKFVLETKDGKMDAVLLSTTIYKRLAPDNLKLSAAVDSTFAEISVGDRVLVTGRISDNGSGIYANKVFLVKGADLEAEAEKQRQDWQRRGVAGKVAAIDPAGKTISVSISSVVGPSTTLTIAAADGTRFKRYSESSPRYSDALDSEFADINEGDNIQALGNKSEDGLSLTAEEVLSGSFITVAGTVKSVDVEKNEAIISDVMTSEDVTIVFNASSQLKMFPEEMAQRFAQFQMMAGQTGGGRPAGVQGQGGGRPGGGQGAGGGRGGMGDINQLSNRFPVITLAELKVGDLIAVSSPKPKVPGRVTAIKLLAGVGPFLASLPKPGSRGGRGVSGGITIPGLDGGVDF